MGEVIQLSKFRKPARQDTAATSKNSLIPIEFAIGLKDRNHCLTKISEYGIRAIHIRRVNDEPNALLYLMGVGDAIWLNKKILEEEELSEDEIAHRIDLIQMMENVNSSLMDSMWESFTCSGQFSSRSTSFPTEA